MCEGIARVGNGECLFAVRAESIVGKCARLLGAGRSRAVESVSIDWGIPMDFLHDSPGTRSASVSFSRHLASTSRAKLFPPAIRQSPAQIQKMFAGMRINIFAILTLKSLKVPKEITLRGQIGDAGGPFEVKVPVSKVQLLDSQETSPPLVHTLAARRLITDTEEGRAPLPRAVGTVIVEDIRKDTIIDLGEEYQLASRYTSFVAVDSGNGDVRQNRQGRSRARQGRNTSFGDPEDGETPSYTTGDPPQGILRQIINFIIPGSSSRHNRASTAGGFEPPGAWPSVSSLNSSRGVLDESDHDAGYDSAATFSTLSSLYSSSEWSEWTPPPSPRVRAGAADIQRSPSPQFQPLRDAPDDVRQTLTVVQPQAPSHPGPPITPENMVELIRLQLFDGSFSLNESLVAIVGSHAVPRDIPPVDNSIWATALAIAFMKKYIGNQPDLLDNLIHKAMEFVEEGPHCNQFNELVRRAEGLIV
jgi:hypothetical protein